MKPTSARHGKNHREEHTNREADITASTVHAVVERAAGMSDDVLKSVESGQRAAIDALRKFVDTVDDALPGKDDHDHPSRGRMRNPDGERGVHKEDCSNSGHRMWLSRASGSMCV